MRLRAWFPLLLVACSSPAKAPVRAAPPATTTTTTEAPAPAPMPPAVSAAPDPAGDGLDELSARAASFIDAFSNAQPTLTRDGKRVVFVSTRDGLPQVYIADIASPSAPAKRLFTWPERVTNLALTADGAWLVFASDKGADENWALYKVRLDGTGDVVPLTSGEPQDHSSYELARGAPDQIVFGGRKRTEATSRVYVASLSAPASPRTVYADPMPAELSDVSPDGKRALAVRYPSQSDNQVLVIDLATGKATQIYPTGRVAAVSSASFSSDGTRVTVATDEGSEKAVVLSLDVKSGKERARYVETRPATATVAATPSERGGLIAVTVVAGEHSELRLLDEKTLQPRAKVAMPLGSGAAVSFSEDGRVVTASWSTPEQPTDIYAIQARSGVARRLRNEPRPSLASLPKIDTTVATVAAFDGGAIPVNVYRPAGSDATPRPVIVAYHGGPASVASIRWNGLIAFFLSLGYVFVEPNIRGSAGFGRAYEAADDGPKRLDAFKDVEATARWVAAQPWADKQRLTVFGSSYGGYTTLIALTRFPDLWRAGVDLVGFVDLNTLMRTTNGFVRQLFLTEFGDPATDAEFLRQISPITDVDAIRAPLFVYAGANDPRVPRTESDAIVKALRGRGQPVEYMVASDEGHSLARRPNQIELYARVARFLAQHLK